MKHETQADRDNELAVITAYAVHTGLAPFKLPDRCFCDFAMIDPRKFVKEYVEIKCKNILPLEFPTINISLVKCLRSLDMAEANGVPFSLICRFSNGAIRRRVITRTDLNTPIQMWGRTNPRDSQEWEPCVLLRSDEFVDVK